MNKLSLILEILGLLSCSAAAYTIEGNQDGAPDLPWGDINLLVLTDDHSWVGGHERKEPFLNAGYGEILSFYQNLKGYCDLAEKDLFFVMNGDWIDGTGLSLNGDTSQLVPLIEKMPFDIVNTGNHELYKTEVVEQMLQPGGFISSWGQRHLASNIIIAETNEPLSNQYTLLQGRNSRILVFGFIYHLQNPSPKVVVLDPNDAMAQPWFETALQENEYDAILVMAHMGIDDEAVSAIRNGIRGIIGDGMPIQFVAGHTHQRRYTQVDDWSMAVESGRYLDTIGFMSFPTQTTIETLASNVSTIDLFQHVFLDANVNMLKYALDTDETFATNDGTELKDFIMQTQNELGLDKILGCSPMDYFINRSLQEPDSLWAVYRDFVVPTQLEQDSDTNRAILISQGSWRYDLFMGENTLDDIVAVSPFNEPIYLVGKMPCQIILSLQDNFNANTTQNFYDVLPAYILSGAVNAGEECELYTHRFDLQSILDSLVLLQPGVVYNAETTNLTSTTIWTGFIQTEWRCQDAKGVHIPWLDSHKIVNESGETNGKNLAIVVSASLVSILFLCGLCFACFRISRGRQPVGDTEMNAFKEDAPIEAEFT